MASLNNDVLNTLLEEYQLHKISLVALLQDIQAQYGYLPREQLQRVSKTLAIPLSKLFCIATFYASFSLKPRGKNIIRICLGTACHVKNGEKLLHLLGRELGLEHCEGTTPDRSFTLTKVRCMGCCSMAPVVKVNEHIHGSLTQHKMLNLLKQYNKADK